MLTVAQKTLVQDSFATIAPIADDAGRMTASPIVTVNLWYDRTVTDTAFVGLPGRTFQWVFDKGRIFGATASHLSLVSSGAERSAPPQIMRTATQQRACIRAEES